LKVIVIDPGHGGKDPGKENSILHVNEKTFTLDVADPTAKNPRCTGVSDRDDAGG